MEGIQHKLAGRHSSQSGKTFLKLLLTTAENGPAVAVNYHCDLQQHHRPNLLSLHQHQREGRCPRLAADPSLTLSKMCLCQSDLLGEGQAGDSPRGSSIKYNWCINLSYHVKSIIGESEILNMLKYNWSFNLSYHVKSIIGASNFLNMLKYNWSFNLSYNLKNIIGVSIFHNM